MQYCWYLQASWLQFSSHCLRKAHFHRLGFGLDRINAAVWQLLDTLRNLNFNFIILILASVGSYLEEVLVAVFVVNRPQLLFGRLGDHFIQLEHDREQILATVARVVDKRLVLVSEFERFERKVCTYPGFVKMQERPQEGGRRHLWSRLARELVLHQSELENVSRQGQLKKRR